ncbi:hypothetical protein SAMN05877753_10678 [Bacillus oleivorans]|uniref:Polymer-forming protein n=1 Tax=Bacillus oleivorans TaxID=1448271 RepID=A0A285CZJ0_9BACI|nr:ABC transporter ATP-binding protein [Bacillus oleivorans]SNX72476.1 hypothetical protein SAMN05877753_10678 [Bacillus oleivorans]
MKKLISIFLAMVMVLTVLGHVQLTNASSEKSSGVLSEKEAIYYSEDRSWVQEGKIKLNEVTYDGEILKEGTLYVKTKDFSGTIEFGDVKLTDYGYLRASGTFTAEDNKEIDFPALINIKEDYSIFSGSIVDVENPDNSKFFVSKIKI